MSGKFLSDDGLTAQGRSVREITPSDSTELPGGPPKALFVTVGGTLRVRAMDDGPGQEVSLGDIAAGTLVPLRVRQVMATGTTATVIAFY